MLIIRGSHNLRPAHRGCVATIGNFDGVHLGHQAVLGQLAEKADELGLPVTVVTFEPQPQEYFRPAAAPPRLTRLREKVQALRRYAVDRLLVLRFDAAFAAQAPQAFIDGVLVNGLGVRYLVIGDDFRFGRQRAGDFGMLRAAGEAHGFEVVNMHTFGLDGERVSSTRVRAALAAGDLNAAEKLLGRPYRMSGRVAHGDKLGRRIGFPTANIHLHRQATPLRGVFAVELYGVHGEPLPGVANLGTRPTAGGLRTLLEAHLFDFDADIYGAHVHVEFLHKLRDERRFDSLDALKAQIAIDARQARDFLGID
ncbi:MAG TPA: bifunctional riboflavin kinase/FAD synthetase [Gammaproteobacteria bacterium]|nr:bifunctional riboflavin kinase/FAD synthetase [Gammaproteobacteria bacterium]